MHVVLHVFGAHHDGARGLRLALRAPPDAVAGQRRVVVPTAFSGLPRHVDGVGGGGAASGSCWGDGGKAQCEHGLGRWRKRAVSGFVHALHSSGVQHIGLQAGEHGTEATE